MKVHKSTGRLSFDLKQRQAATKLLHRLLDIHHRASNGMVSRSGLCNQMGVRDNELQRLVMLGYLPRKPLKLDGSRCYMVCEVIAGLEAYLGNAEPPYRKTREDTADAG